MLPPRRHTKWNPITLVVMLLFAVAGLGYAEKEGSPSEKSQDVLHVLYTKQHISVNGIATEWARRSSISFKSSVLDEQGRQPETFVKTAWDDANLYFTFFIEDWDLVALAEEDEARINCDDGIGIYLSTAPDKAIEGRYSPDEYYFSFNLNRAVESWRGTSGGKKDTSWNGAFVTGVRWVGSLNDRSGLPDESYRLEVAIPWKILSYKPRQNAELSVSFSVTDRRAEPYDSGFSKNLPYHRYSWSEGTRDPFDPTRWNRLVLLKAPTEAEARVSSEEKTASNAVSNAWLGWILLFGVSSLGLLFYFANTWERKTPAVVEEKPVGSILKVSNEAMK